MGRARQPIVVVLRSNFVFALSRCFLVACAAYFCFSSGSFFCRLEALAVVPVLPLYVMHKCISFHASGARCVFCSQCVQDSRTPHIQNWSESVFRLFRCKRKAHPQTSCHPSLRCRSSVLIASGVHQRSRTDCPEKSTSTSSTALFTRDLRFLVAQQAIIIMHALFMQQRLVRCGVQELGLTSSPASDVNSNWTRRRRCARAKASRRERETKNMSLTVVRTIDN